MKKKNNLIAALLLTTISMLASSCSDWLDVKPDDQQREQDMFSTVNGFKDALAGCYNSLASQSIYGMRLTMTDVDCLAGLWAEPSETYRAADYYLYHHQYDNDAARTAIKDIYTGLYNVVAQANLVLKHVEESDGNVIRSTQLRNVIAGEAYAIRALCHLDVLRLFGQMPQNPAREVKLPYAEEASIDYLAPYYDFSDFVGKLLADLNQAEVLLQQSDPLKIYDADAPSESTASSNPADNDASFLVYRGLRLNLWAVRALKSRLYLYIGRTSEAYRQARAIIDAKDEDGNAYLTLSTRTDIQSEYYAIPSECILGISCDQLGNYAISTLGGDATALLDANNTLHITPAMLNQLYTYTQSDVRFLYQWEQTRATYGIYPTVKKYYYDTSAGYSLDELLTRREVVPLIRLSEIYLIAMETTEDLAEANSLYKDYMKARNVSIDTDFKTLDAMRQEVRNEYLREFYGEGVVFYQYKRLGLTSLRWNTTEQMGDNQYVLPLPLTEYDPAQNVEP